MRNNSHSYRAVSRVPRPHPAMFASFMCVLYAGTAVHAMPQVDILAEDQVSVRELMRLETEVALRMARERANPVVAAVSAPVRASRSTAGEPTLAAIYGVGSALMAEVALSGETFLYRKGLALPVGTAPGPDVYLLKDISASCVELQRQDSSQRLCLTPAKWAAK